jgi:16S rRNA (uracil1498-N3)-methyltransferase
MHLFYVPNISGAEVILDETESKHAIRVLRLEKGEKIRLIDGKGGFYLAEIADANPKKCKLAIIESERNFSKRNFHLHIAIAPTKNNERLEWFLEKATEIGIDEITPLITERSERKTVNPERLEKILVSAMKQSVKAYLPKLNNQQSFKELVKQPFDGKKVVAYIEEKQTVHLKNVVGKTDNVLVLIGPEGDFSPAEVQLALQNGFQPVSLGDSRLRTETAGIVACHIVNLAND